MIESKIKIGGKNEKNEKIYVCTQFDCYGVCLCACFRWLRCDRWICKSRISHNRGNWRKSWCTHRSRPWKWIWHDTHYKYEYHGREIVCQRKNQNFVWRHKRDEGDFHNEHEWARRIFENICICQRWKTLHSHNRKRRWPQDWYKICKWFWWRLWNGQWIWCRWT